MTPLKSLVLADFYSYILVTARLGGLLFFSPGFSEPTIPRSVKALIVLALGTALTPFIVTKGVTMPHTGLESAWLLMVEALIGYTAALVVRFLFSALDLTGSLIGYQIGLANAFAMSPASAQQSALPGVFLGTAAILFMILLDMHHMIIQAFVHSYQALPLGGAGLSFFAERGSGLLLEAATTSITLGLQLAGPILITILFFFAGAGLANRLAPAIQIFFVSQPLQILLGFFVMAITLPALLTLFSQALPESLAAFFAFLY
ncbi:MAG: flagellar biosynthetic protein FliR [Alphaproteobacteria bacterium]|jgi:flagellar biosynthetic protein FliR|nr:flagellar biosynthetic protein FliR [Alphaproteobacteria bacterium]